MPAPLPEVWNFFSRPENLAQITPEEMAFEMLTDLTDKPMYEGMFIQHRVKPVAGIPLNWTSEITHINAPHYFIDEQRSGPYAMWHHEHHFEEAEGGTRMEDLLFYAIPFGPIGRLANALLVDRKVEEIFRHREKAIDRLFR